MRYFSVNTNVRSGSTQAWLLVCLPVLLGVAAITIDGGRTMEERRVNQVVADAAALAAASDLYAHYWTAKGLDLGGTARAAAIQTALSNNLPADRVTVNIPPKSGAFVGQRCHAEVVLQTQVS